MEHTGSTRGAVVSSNCVMATAQACFADGGRGFESGSCATAAADTCDTAAGLVYDGSSMCIAASVVNVNVAVTGIDTRAKALELFTGDKTSGTATVKNIRTEYQNQPSLDVIGAAQAYVSGVAMSSANVTNLSQLRLGRDSQVSVITNKRFDYYYPEFSTSKDNASYETLTRIALRNYRMSASGATAPTDFADVITSFFAQDTSDQPRVQVYSEGFTAATTAFVTIRVPDIAGNQFEKLSRSRLGDGTADLRTFLRTIAGGPFTGSGASDLVVTSFAGNFYFINNGTLFYGLELAAGNSENLDANHLGRVYSSGNVASYQIVVTSGTVVRGETHIEGNQCITDPSPCYAAGVPAGAEADEMGVLALINGLLDGEGGDANTHGVAPAATLDVFTTPAADATSFNGADLIYLARGIDVARDVSSGNLVADSDRNIVLIQNVIAASSATADFGADLTAVDATVAASGVYKTMFDALKVGLANDEKQDAYIFAARDGSKDDVGLLAGLPLATGSGFAEYSIIVVAVEDGTTQCGTNTAVQAICIAAPGTYKYRARDTGITPHEYTSTTLQDGAATANAAASLVAGGLALLQSIFPMETTERLVDRLLLTASRDYDLDVDTNPGNDFSAQKHGQGLLDLDCAVRPALGAVTSRTRTGCTNRFETDQAAVCFANGQGYDGSNCVNCTATQGIRSSGACTSAPMAGDCERRRLVLDDTTTNCIAAGTCTGRSGSMRRFISSTSRTCVAMCTANQGVDTNKNCTDTADDTTCGAHGRFLSAGNCIGMCPVANGLQGNTCVATTPTAVQCAANMGGLLNVATGVCIASGACASPNFINDSNACVASCPANEGADASRNCVAAASVTAMQCANVNLVLLTGTGCVSSSNCQTGQGVEDDTCTAYGSLTDAATGCTAAGGQVPNTTTMMCEFSIANDIVEAFRGMGNTADDSDLIDSSGFNDSSTTAQKRQREYANQQSLDIVGAAFAYGRAGKTADDLDAALAAGFGAGSNISVVTNKRFDPNHPEFSSNTATSFKTLARLRASDLDETDVFSATTPGKDLLSVFFANDANKVVVPYSDTTRASHVLFTVQVGQINGMNLEAISRNDIAASTATTIRNEIATFIASLVGGTGPIANPKNTSLTVLSSNEYYYDFNTGVRYYLNVASMSGNVDMHYVGRVYDSGNIRSYQIVMDTDNEVRNDADKNECNTNNNCYASGVPAVANGAEMGILALINGLMNPDATGVAYNTHGIVPGAKLDVITTPAVGAGHNGADTIYRARSIDVGRDVTDAGVFKADGDRNIVIIQNNLAASGATGDVGSDATAVTTASTGVYKAMFDALKVGLADTATQDIYVFAARDGNKDDVGLLAGLSLATASGFAEYSIIVVAVEDDTTQCGSNTDVQAICIAAPGTYQYRNRMNDGTYETSLTTSTSASANAAASLVAGGLALLESVFEGETTARLIDRLLKTASQTFSLDSPPGANQYTINKHGQGLMDLACAIKPHADLSAARIRTGCVDRFAPSQAGICLGMMQGYNSVTEACVTSGITAAQCVAAGGVKNGSDDECIARRACATVFNAGGDTCIAMCAMDEGATSARVCGATASNDNCMNAMRRFDVASGDCRADNTCGANEVVGDSTFGTNSCYTLAECVGANGGLSATSNGMCVAASGGTCFNAGSSTYFFEGGECVRSCSTSPVMRSAGSMNTCVTAANCRSQIHTGSATGAVRRRIDMGVPVFDCRVASGPNCENDNLRAFNSAGTGCIRSCITEDNGRGRDRTSNQCVAASEDSCAIAVQGNNDEGFFDRRTSMCVTDATECSNGQFGEFDGGSAVRCVTDCTDTTDGVNVENICTATSLGGSCLLAERLVQGGVCTEACGTTTPYYDGTDTCVAADGCVANNQGVSTMAAMRFGRTIAPSGECATANAGTCYNAGAETQFFDSVTSNCVTACDATVPLRLSMGSMNTCVTAATCRTGGTRAAVRDDCVAAGAQACFDDEGRGFSGGICVTPDAANDCDTNLGFVWDGDSMCIVSSPVDVAVGTGNSEAIIDTKAKALALFTGTPGTATTAEKIATEYQNQPALALVGAAEAYVSEVASSGENIRNLNQLNIGTGSQISVITDKRFDPNHPEFSSTNDAAFRTLTRFRLEDNSGNNVFVGVEANASNVLRLFFGGDTEQSVGVYLNRADSDDAYITVSVGEINSMKFEDISRDEFTADDGVAIRNAVQTFFRGIVGGGTFITDNKGEVKKSGDDYIYSLDTAGNYLIHLIDDSNSRNSFVHLGRIYDLRGNLASYQIVIHPNSDVRADDDEGECIADEECYDSHAPAAASDAEMGVLALINGMLDGAGGTANTHGIAPGATLKVLTGLQFGDSRDAGRDIIYRARGIDLARDRDGSNNLIADTDRNIVIIQNNIFSPLRTDAVTLANIDDVIDFAGSVIRGSYRDAFRALNFGVIAPADATAGQRAAQDIYVFAAQDDRADEKNPGLLASITVATPSNFEAYSVVVVAAESGANAFCGTLTVDLCLAAPGSYTYRTRETDGSYTSTTLATVTTPTSNAAASLVAGGFAILEERFGRQMGSDELVARMLATASQCFNIEGAAGDPWGGSMCDSSKNDYVSDTASPTGIDFLPNRYGQGLMDLECATRPSATQTRCRYAFAPVDADEIVEAFRGAGNTAETSALIDSSSFTDSSTTAQKRQREYANQPSLDIVGAAFAYGKVGDGAAGIAAAIHEAGKGSNISVVTNKRFEPNHPEFSSSASDATFDTLTRFFLHFSESVRTPPATVGAVMPAVFNTGEGRARVQVYSDGFDSSVLAYLTIQVPDIAGGAFEAISRDAFGDATNGATARTDLETFLQRIVHGTGVDTTGAQAEAILLSTGYYFNVQGAGDDLASIFIELTDGTAVNNYNHVGRFYTSGNLRSYQIVIDTGNAVRANDDDGECVRQ